MRGHCWHGTPKRQWRWLKKLWCETGPSSQGLSTGEIHGNWWIFRVGQKSLSLSTKKSMGMRWDEGPLVPLYWMEGLEGFVYFNEQLLLDILQMEIKPLWSNNVFFRSCLYSQGVCFFHSFFQKPDGVKFGPKPGHAALALVQGVKKSESCRCWGLSVKILSLPSKWNQALIYFVISYRVAMSCTPWRTLSHAPRAKHM